MKKGEPSRTAMATAAARAAHLILDGEPKIFEDTLAYRLLGDQAEELIDVHRDPESAPMTATMRVAMTTRGHYTEHHLSEAVGRGIDQCVILGAGLDSLAYRSRLVGTTVFEVDHPSTQAWKRERLASASIPVPKSVTFVAVDFSVDSLSERLAEMGFDRSRPAFVTWIGVTPYLTTPAIGSTLDVIGTFAQGSELVVEYLVPDELRDDLGRALADWFMPRAARVGEPMQTFLLPAEMAALLRARGLNVVQDVGRRESVDPSVWRRSDGLVPNQWGRLARARLV